MLEIIMENCILNNGKLQEKFLTLDKGILGNHDRSALQM